MSPTATPPGGPASRPREGGLGALVARRPRSPVEEGLRECGRVARAEAKTFYVAFCMLPPERRRAICTLYAFSRVVDDIADDRVLPVDEKTRRLDGCRSDLDAVYGGTATQPRLIALSMVAERHRIPRSMLETLIDGVAMDLEPRRHRDIEDLRAYCHAVAGVIGQMCVRIFGAADGSADALADELGFALQLTNILRDLAEDAADGRFYLPLDHLEAAGVSEADVLRHDGTPGTPAARVLAALGDGAAAAFAAGDALLPLVPRSSRPCLAGIALLYRGYLDRLRARGFAATGPRVRIAAAGKLALAARAAVHGAFAGGAAA